MIHLISSLVLALALTALSFYPFLPGAFDAAAQPISTTAQFAVLGGALFLSAPGIAWLLRSIPARPANPPPRSLLLLTWVALAATGGSAALGAWIGGSLLLAAFSFSLTPLALRLLHRFCQPSLSSRRGSRVLGAYLALTPLTAVILQLALASPVTAFSRNYAIDQSATLIAGIERHFVQRSTYPDSLVALWPDFRPGIIGIPHYEYARHGNAYTLSFRQPTLLFPEFGSEEVVFYNPRDEHLFPSHAAWALEWPLEQRMANQGWFARFDTGRPHWKFARFD